MQVFKKVRDTYLFSTMRQLSGRDAAWFLLSEGFWRLSGGRMRVIKYHFLVQPLKAPAGVQTRPRGNLEIREVYEGDPVFGSMGRPSECVRSRFEQGARCLVALKNDELAGFLWWTEGPYKEDEVRCTFEPSPAGVSVWDFDVFVFPKHRLSMTFPRLWQEASRRLSEQGFKYTCSRISAFNPGSLRSHQQMKSKVVGSRVFIGIGSLELSVGRGRPRLSMSRKGSSGPWITIAP
ncbi:MULTISPECIES: hypothetical protein [unclassified Ectothiorhodospira]|uniref:hypothetical protein n=1 Tax=unclassified Ectothiorhodospira TaxID=2684909 RepID=UPI001EE91B87|nr:MULTISPECIES: hypothetical protein [unclassified Ectothiorhodospira]MCG5517091.1 hypothetical protein [Ectothiorhodospira sp. 9100]MCG5519753.1 hypothetical protein [Ectothiorhodospira sp. 9905]